MLIILFAMCSLWRWRTMLHHVTLDSYSGYFKLFTVTYAIASVVNLIIASLRDL